MRNIGTIAIIVLALLTIVNACENYTTKKELRHLKSYIERVDYNGNVSRERINDLMNSVDRTEKYLNFIPTFKTKIEDGFKVYDLPDNKIYKY